MQILFASNIKLKNWKRKIKKSAKIIDDKNQIAFY